MGVGRAFQGWWGQVRQRPGWSNDVSKPVWAALQVVIPFAAAYPILFAASRAFGEESAPNPAELLILSLFPIAGLAAVNLGRWDDDQRALNGAEPKRYGVWGTLAWAFGGLVAVAIALFGLDRLGVPDLATRAVAVVIGLIAAMAVAIRVPERRRGD